MASNALAQIAVDKVHGYPLQNDATYATYYTAGGGGHTGQSGDSAMDLGTGGGTSLFVTDPGFLAALNAAAANDTLSVSLWIQLSAISDSSAFWFYAPDQGRAFQAHTPWGDNDTVYFDTSGCCDGGQRIYASITTFPGYTGADTWWNSWHHFVFLKNGPDKQVWIDGALFLEGQSTAPLVTDMNLVDVGSQIHAGGRSLEGKIDDFAVFGKPLSSNEVHQIFTGTSPASLSGADPLAFWDFNPQKTIFAPIQAGPGATGVSPDLAAHYVIANGGTAVQPNSIKLSVNGTDVTGAASITPTAVPPVIEGTTAGATIRYTSPTPFPPASTQTVTLVFSDNAAPAIVFSNTWPVVIEPYNGYVTDAKNGHLGFLEGGAFFTPDGGGHTGNAGDRAIDLERAPGGGAVHVRSANFLNLAAASNTLSFSLWMKLHALYPGAVVYARSPSTGGGERGFAVLPWSDDTIYFDTAGCCDASLQRIKAPINTLPAFTDDSFWTNWHNFVFLYNAGDKQVWVDGVQLIEGSSASPLPTDFRDLFFGFDAAGNFYQQAWIDDVAVYSTALSPASIGSLTNGTLPTALAGETVLAYWNFDSLNSGPPIIAASSTPTPGSINNPPDVGANIYIVNRDTQVQTTTISLAINGTDETSASTISATPYGAEVTFLSARLLPQLSTNAITVTYSDNAIPPNQVSNSWSFIVGPYSRYSRDTLHGYLALFQGDTSLTPDAGGHSGAHGDRALDLSAAGGGGGATAMDPPFLNAVNAAAAKDALSVSFWLKQSPISSSSALWFNSPSVGRAFQAHVPWSDDTIYFDTGNGGPNRISGNINTFAGWSSDAFWTNWHNFVLLKTGGHKEVWIDGQMFLSGDGAAPLATDISQLFIASGSGIPSPIGQMDDFAVFGEALSTNQIVSIAAGTSPPALNDTNLLAFWNFQDVGPAFVSSLSPAPNATGIAATGPLSHVVAVLVDGSTAVNTNSIRLGFKGADVTAAATLTTRAGGVTQVEYAPAMMPSGSANSVTLLFNDTGSPPNLVSNTWSYATELYSGVTRDLLHGYLGLLQPSARFTTNGGGHTGISGDFAIDTTPAGGPVHIDDATFLYPAETNNTMTFSFWAKKYDIASGSAFWVDSPSSPAGQLGAQAYLPYSDDTIYFDTSGCCDLSLQRISANINTFLAWKDDSFWTNSWHHFVFLYNAGDKRIWIDGSSFLEGNSSLPLALDFTDMFLASGGMHSLIDDFAAFASPVAMTNIALLAQGTLPTALANEKLLAYWNFNDAPSAPTIKIGFVSGQLRITYTGTLQSSATVNGTYLNVNGATSPYTVDTSLAPRTFYRARQ